MILNYRETFLKRPYLSRNHRCLQNQSLHSLPESFLFLWKALPWVMPAIDTPKLFKTHLVINIFILSYFTRFFTCIVSFRPRPTTSENCSDFGGGISILSCSSDPSTISDITSNVIFFRYSSASLDSFKSSFRVLE